MILIVAFILKTLLTVTNLFRKDENRRAFAAFGGMNL